MCLFSTKVPAVLSNRIFKAGKEFFQYLSGLGVEKIPTDVLKTLAELLGEEDAVGEVTDATKRFLEIFIKFADFGKTKVEDTYHYKLFYLQNKSAANMTGMKHKDEKNGIIHLGIGENRGLLKNISFKRANMPGLREQRVVEENAFNPLSHLADVYNIEVSMIGNTIFYPGQYVYVNPLGFGAKLGKPTQPRSPSRAMGLGGYHMITQVSSFIESGKFETTVTALWETSGGPGADRNDRGESTGTQDCVGIQDEATAPDLEIESNIAEGTPE